ncbi:MAG: bifunctional (p)ppGpp synthetase/guanosine-3',5'-bis(diphosphate) 3'-pyrophosphohydrolase [Bacilli bacterium]
MPRSKKLITYEELENKIKKYIKNKEALKKIKDAYEFSKEKHLGQKRETGEDFIQHPLNVASILTEIYADISAIIAALLHETPIVNITTEEIKEKFGEEIALLVEGVRKISKLKFSSETEYIAENTRKIIVGISEDVRVIIIKLADRLHNMQTLWCFPKQIQKKKAKETLQILTPIAHRLGMQKLKHELEDISLRYLKPDVFFDIVEKLNKTKAERDNMIKQMIDEISALLKEHRIKFEIKGRSKSIYSIYNKMNTGRKFENIYDLQALRIYVNTEAECYTVMGLIHSKYKPVMGRFKDYIANPKNNMYQSLHTTVFGISGHHFEIQIRTYEMDEIAERGIAAHWSYKEHKSVNKSMKNIAEQKLKLFRSIIELQDEKISNEELIKSIKEDLLGTKIYVYTPNGDVIELAKGSNPVDFAYRVHTDVGHKMVGALVNDKIVPLSTKLKTGDIVKIITNKNSTPSREWYDIAKTQQAKSKIKSFFTKINKEDYIKDGEEKLLKEIRKNVLPIKNTLDNIEKNFMKEQNINNLNDLYYFIGTKKYTSNQIVNSITKKDITSINKFDKTTKSNKFIINSDIIVEGINNIKINHANCCKPIYGDEIIGYITRGKGITIHRANCHNIAGTNERTIEVKWNKIVGHKYPTNIIVYSKKDRNLLTDIVNQASIFDINIESINTLKNNNIFIYDITILVEDTIKLANFINSLKNIRDINRVERLIK